MLFESDHKPVIEFETYYLITKRTICTLRIHIIHRSPKFILLFYKTKLTHKFITSIDIQILYNVHVKCKEDALNTNNFTGMKIGAFYSNEIEGHYDLD